MILRVYDDLDDKYKDMFKLKRREIPLPDVFFLPGRKWDETFSGKIQNYPKDDLLKIEGERGAEQNQRIAMAMRAILELNPQTSGMGPWSLTPKGAWTSKT